MIFLKRQYNRFMRNGNLMFACCKKRWQLETKFVHYKMHYPAKTENKTPCRTVLEIKMPYCYHYKGVKSKSCDLIKKKG